MPLSRPKAALFSSSAQPESSLWRVFDECRLARLKSLATLYPTVITRANFEEHCGELGDLEFIFSTWGMWGVGAAHFEKMPQLKGLFYAAGSVQPFARPFLERDIKVVSSWAANAVPVAEFTLSQILLASKGYWRNVDEYKGRADRSTYHGRGNYGAAISLLGAGQIGRKLIELLRPFHLRVLVFDPFLSAKGAEQLGVEKVELMEAFERGSVISNHLANLPETVGMLRAEHFRAMPPNATFINTGRGATVNHVDLTACLTERSDVTALLDVTDPEPLPLSHPLRTLPNVHLTNHIAGSIGDEVARMADLSLDEFENILNGVPLRYAVSMQMLETMA